MSDKHAQRELFLFIVNDGALFRQQGEPIIKNLQKKYKKGVFDQAKAVKLYRYLADNGAKKYTFEHDTPGAARSWPQVKGFGIFSVADRNAVARELLDYYHEQIMQHDYSKNPSRRKSGRTIRRAGLSLQAYVRRPSQITGKSPGKRLLKRRSKRVAKPVKGFFPNPAQTIGYRKYWIYISDLSGKERITVQRPNYTAMPQVFKTLTAAKAAITKESNILADSNTPDTLLQAWHENRKVVQWKMPGEQKWSIAAVTGGAASAKEKARALSKKPGYEKALYRVVG